MLFYGRGYTYQNSLTFQHIKAHSKSGLFVFGEWRNSPMWKTRPFKVKTNY